MGGGKPLLADLKLPAPPGPGSAEAVTMENRTLLILLAILAGLLILVAVYPSLGPWLAGR